jgi:hypothetical protein
MKIHRHHCTVALATILWIVPAFADSETAGRSFIAPVGEGTLNSSAGSARSGAEIHAGSESSKAYIKLGRTLSGQDLFSVFALTASAPLDKKSDTTSLATLDAFANAFTLELKLTGFSTHRVNVAKADWSQHKVFYNELKEAIAHGALAKGEVKDLKEGREQEVDTNNVLKYAPDLEAAFESLTRDRTQWDTTWGITGTVGHQSYSYLVQPALAKESTDKIPWGGKVFLGFMPGGDDTLLTFSFEYQDGFKDADSKTLVLPVDANGVQEAKTGPIGSPKSDRKKLAALELRRFIMLPNAKKPIGLNLKVTYDFEEETLGVDMPVWMIRDAKGNLTGGLSFGWTEKDDKFTVGVIVGGAFGFF